MKVAVVGGGPGGLYLAGLLGERIPATEVTVYDRGSAEDTYGFGVVFSEPTLRHLREEDPGGFDHLFAGAARWPGIDIWIKGERWRCGGNGFSAIERRRLLGLLAARAERAGAQLRWKTDLDPGADELAGADLVVIANGANSSWRTEHAERLVSSVQASTAKFIWFGATKVFDGMTFLFEENEHGWFAVHAYPYNSTSSTFVVETDEATWRAAGLDAFDTTQPPGPSDTATAAYMERLFARHLDGGRMILNNSRWANFRTVRTRHWRIDDRTVLLGDAAHTAHFSVGSGTKMAMEDALALTTRLTAYATGEQPLAAALRDYETERERDVRRIQDLARPSLTWWENFAEYAQLSPAQFVLHFLTRSGRVGRARLRRSDPDFAARAFGQIVGDPSGSVLRAPLRTGGSGLSPIRLVGLGEPGAPGGPGEAARNGAVTPPPWTAPDLGGQVAPGSVTDLDVENCTDRAVWMCAPATLGELDQAMARARPRLEPARVVFIDVRAVPGPGREAGAEALVVQQRVAEILRLRLDKTAVVVRREATADEAATLVLSGRADAVAVPTSRLPDLLSDELAGD
jgi:2-polyprenyl-6-methoxyphenol hydroxylase-like FAD-dependent oxidoreductase